MLYLLIIKANITLRENNWFSTYRKEFLCPDIVKKAGTEVKKAMHERKKGTLKSGKSGKKVTSKKQAIAIGLSKARKKGAKVPRKRSST